MTQRANDLCPHEILEWIAWYPDGGLSDAQRGAVEAHAAVCSACRDEIAVLAGRAEAPVAPPDPERLFARVLSLVEADGLAAPAGAELLAAPERGVAVRGQRAPARASGRAAVAGGARLAASLALVLLTGALGGWLVGRGRVDALPVYVPASAPPAASERVLLDVVFRGDASAERIQTALRGLGAEVVGGPSPLGRYRIALAPGTDASAAAAGLRAEGTGVASFAEPLRP
jgi:hypothetical protein